MTIRFFSPLAWTALLALSLRAHPAQADAYATKANYLFQFAEYVDWPGSSSLNFCVVGPDPFGAKLAAALKDKSIGGRKLRSKHIDGGDQASECQILFVSRELGGGMAGVLQKAGEGVLTVGDTPGFAQRGGMINFIEEGGVVRFEINQSAAKRAGLKLSSKLLRLARKVY